MGKFQKVIRVARVLTNTDIGRGTTNCEGCGKEMKAHKSNVCSDRCARFLSETKYSR